MEKGFADDDLYKSLDNVKQKSFQDVIEPKFREVPNRFVIKYSSPHRDMDIEEFIMMRDKEKFLLKILFVALLFLLYGMF